jgi:hypothetical protein
MREIDFVTGLDKAEAHDLVIMAFALSEVDEAAQAPFVEALWVGQRSKSAQVAVPGPAPTSKTFVTPSKQASGIWRRQACTAA